MTIDARIVELATVPLPGTLGEVRQQFAIELGEAAADKAYPLDDWKRVAYVLEMVPAGSVLDVGTGQGQFSNALARLGWKGRHATIDIGTHSRFRKQGNYEKFEMSVASMTFATGEFDTVVAMEIIEHLSDEIFESALRELRRVASKKLIITIPFCEPLPLPPYHHQRFVTTRVLSLFPDAKFTLLLKSSTRKVPWLLIEEIC